MEWQGCHVFVMRLFDTFGSLKGIIEARPEQLMSVDGMTQSRASMISLIVLLTRVWHRCMMTAPDRIGNSCEAEKYCMSLLAGERLENFFVVALNAKCNILGPGVAFGNEKGRPQRSPDGFACTKCH